MKIKVILSVIIALIGNHFSYAATKNIVEDDSSSTVISCQHNLPIETRVSGIITSIESPSTPLKVSTNMVEATEQWMRQAASHPELIKNYFMTDLRELDQPIFTLAKVACDAGIPLQVFFYTESYPEGFTINFSVEDLDKGLTNLK